MTDMGKQEARALCLQSFQDAPLISARGSHRMLLSHVCIGRERNSERLTLDAHRYHRGGYSVTNVHEDCEQVYMVLSRRGEVTLNEKTYPLKRGSVVFIPRHTRHSIRNTRDEELVLVFISTYLGL